MAVEINLLQKEKKRSQGFFLLTSLLTIASVLIIAVCFYFAWQLNEKINTASNQLEQEQSINQTLQTQLDGTEEQGEINQHEQFIVEIVNRHPEIAGHLNSIASQLPSTGRIDSLSYESQQFALTVQVGTSSQAVSYLNQLKEVEGLQEVLIHSIQSQPEENGYSANYSIVVEAGDAS